MENGTLGFLWIYVCNRYSFVILFEERNKIECERGEGGRMRIRKFRLTFLPLIVVLSEMHRLGRGENVIFINWGFSRPGPGFCYPHPSFLSFIFPLL